MSFVKQMNQYGKRQVPFLFVLDYQLKQPFVKPLTQIDSRHILYAFKQFSNLKEKAQKFSGTVFIKAKPRTYTKYLKAFDRVQKHLRQGDSYLVNLTFPTPVKLNLSLREIFIHAQAPYRLLMSNRFVCFSPEPFVRIVDGKIYTYPMKGTIDKHKPDALNLLLHDAKEQAEHLTVVDLLRSDLNRVAKEVKVEAYRQVSEVVTSRGELLQTSSVISGQLPADYACRLGDIFQELLPAGSICGAPKKKTLQVIKEAEKYNRGYYSGVFGYFDGKNIESAVMIRFIEKQGQHTLYKSGGGITLDSDPAEEYKEMLEKIYVPIR